MRFLAHLFAGIIVVMAVVGGINLLIDPFDVWQSPRIAGISTSKSLGNIRYVKPLQVEVRHPRTVILGSSRVQYGIDPRDFPDGKRIYNFGIPAVTAAEMKGYAAHILETTDATELIVGLDFFSFNDAGQAVPDYDNAPLGRWALWRAAPVLLFSQTALERSRHTVVDFRKRPEGYDHGDGFSVFQFDPGKDPVPEFMEMVGRFANRRDFYGGFRSFERSMEDYRSVLMAARAKGVRLTTFISPEHAVLLETIDRLGAWPIYQAWKRRLVQLSTALDVPLWDFSGYNDYTTTALQDGYRSFFDGSHFRPEIGRLIMARLRGGDAPADFGVRLTPDNIDERLAETDEARTVYRRSHVEDVARVATTLAQLPATRR